jgi:hypothetical protein
MHEVEVHRYNARGSAAMRRSRDTEGASDFTHILKIDMGATAGKGFIAAIEHPSGITAAEFTFVARRQGIGEGGRWPKYTPTDDEDDGFLVGFAVDRKSGQSFCMVCALARVL